MLMSRTIRESIGKGGRLGTMEVVRVIAMLALCGGLGALAASSLWSGLRTGKMPHSDSTSTYDRMTQPVRFWFVAVLFLMMLAIFAFAAAHSIIGLFASP